jgi:hypothetical protein
LCDNLEYESAGVAAVTADEFRFVGLRPVDALTAAASCVPSKLTSRSRRN